jgi:hypothetical protein
MPCAGNNRPAHTTLMPVCLRCAHWDEHATASIYRADETGRQWCAEWAQNPMPALSSDRPAAALVEG